MRVCVFPLLCCLCAVIQQKRTGTPADIWSLGATVVEMASGSPPYSEFSNNLATMFHIATSGNAPKVPDTLSDTAKDFLSLVRVACVRGLGRRHSGV